MTRRLLASHKALLGVLVAASLTASWSAARQAWIDFQFMKPRAVIEGWKQGEAPSIRRWGKTRDELEQVRQMNPNDPQVLESLGFLYGLQALRSEAVPELQQALLDEAISDFRAATRLRPMSPFAWSNLAFALHKKGQANEEMWAAYDRAMRYGRREGAVQHQLAEIGFAHWATLDGRRRQQLQQMVEAANENNKKDLLAIASRNQVDWPADSQ